MSSQQILQYTVCFFPSSTEPVVQWQEVVADHDQGWGRENKNHSLAGSINQSITRLISRESLISLSDEALTKEDALRDMRRNLGVVARVLSNITGHRLVTNFDEWCSTQSP